MFRFATMILRVFIETDDCLAKKKGNASIDLLHDASSFAGGNVFDYFRTFASTKIRSSHRDAPPTLSLSSVRQIDASWIYSGWACSVVSWNNALQTDPCRFVAICKPSTVSTLPSCPATATRDAAAKFSSDKISAEQLYREMSWAESLFSTNGFPWNR